MLLALTAIASVLGASYDLDAFKKERGKPVVSTTTSLFDTGLLDHIEDLFEEEYPLDLYFISVGTDLAIQHAHRGDADMILVHSPFQERTFLEKGYGVCRKIIAYNFFAIVGPENDPAGIRGQPPPRAIAIIVESGRNGGALWVSRGDDSGTHTKEKGLWSASGFDWNTLRNEDWYRESGTGMGKTLVMTEEFGAYTLTDIGTYLKYKKDVQITLEILGGSGKELLNVYSAIAVNPETISTTNIDNAITFMKFLVSDDGQTLIGEFGEEKYGEPLFHPAVTVLQKKTDPTIAQWIEELAYFDEAECLNEYRCGHPEIYP